MLQNVLGIIAAAISVLTSVVAITVVIVTMKSNLQNLKDQEERQTAKDEQVAKEFSELLVLIKAFMAEQNVINKQVAGALDSIVRKLEATEHKAIESAALVGLLADAMKRRLSEDLTKKESGD